MRCLAECSEAGNEKGNGYGAGGNVRADNQQLESGSVGAQHNILATAHVNQYVLEARQGRNNGCPRLTHRGADGLCDSRQ